VGFTAGNLASLNQPDHVLRATTAKHVRPVSVLQTALLVVFVRLVVIALKEQPARQHALQENSAAWLVQKVTMSVQIALLDTIAVAATSLHPRVLATKDITASPDRPNQTNILFPLVIMLRLDRHKLTRVAQEHTNFHPQKENVRFVPLAKSVQVKQLINSVLQMIVQKVVIVL
jgi:hypothetical protein